MNQSHVSLFTPDPVTIQPTVAKLKAEQSAASVQDVVRQLREAKAAKNARDKHK